MEYLIKYLPPLSRLFWLKYPLLSHLISVIYLRLTINFKLKSLPIKGISEEKLEELVHQNKYKYDFFGDVSCCALLSIHTLSALSVSNKSWLRLSKILTEEEDGGRLKLNITVPPAKENTSHTTDFFIQCLCISHGLEDFVLYVTDIKLFNICNYWNKNSSFLVKGVNTEGCDDYCPEFAKSVTISGIRSGNDISCSDYEDALKEYFTIPRCLKLNEVFHINLSKYGQNLKSRVNLCTLKVIYLKVISIEAQQKQHSSGNKQTQDYYILKNFTSVNLSAVSEGFVPWRRLQFIKTSPNIPGFDITLCPDGLMKYFTKIEKILKFLIVNKNAVKGRLLLYGLKGSGKKATLKCVTASLGLHLLNVNCLDFYGRNVSVIENQFVWLFQRALQSGPCVVFFENVEFLGREQNYRENARLVHIFESQLRRLWEMISENSWMHPLFIVGSTHLKPSDLVPTVARLFVHSIAFEAQKPGEAYNSLSWLVNKSNMICSSEVLKQVEGRVRGYVFADLDLLLKHVIHFQSRESSGGRELHYRFFNQAIEIMEAAYSDSIGAAKVPTVHWSDVGGLTDLKEEIMLTLNLPIKHPELFASGLKRSGILFYGPPGTGKTLMAKAVATECNYNFLSVKGPELMNMYVGQSEKNVREVFEKAREASPCIIFFDELDSLAPSRGKSGDSGGVTDRVVSQLLAEMDGLDKNKDLFVIAATNRPDLVDQALLRPGRFDKMFYVGVCKDFSSKRKVLEALTRRFNLNSCVSFEDIIKQLPSEVTGADLYSVCSNTWFSAARKAVRAAEKGVKVDLPLVVKMEDFLDAIEQFVPSLTAEDVYYYDNFKSFKDFKTGNSSS